MPNKNRTACNRRKCKRSRSRSRSQGQRRRYLTARNGGRSPWLFSSEASDTRRRTNVPAKIWLSPRRWNAERKTRNLANQIAIQRNAVERVRNTHQQCIATAAAAADTRKTERVLNDRLKVLNAMIQDPAHRNIRDSLIAEQHVIYEQLNGNGSGAAVYYKHTPANIQQQRMPL